MCCAAALRKESKSQEGGYYSLLLTEYFMSHTKTQLSQGLCDHTTSLSTISYFKPEPDAQVYIKNT